MTAVLGEIDVKPVEAITNLTGMTPSAFAAGSHFISQQRSPTSGGRLEVCLFPGGRRPPGPDKIVCRGKVSLGNDKKRDQLESNGMQALLYYVACHRHQSCCSVPALSTPRQRYCTCMASPLCYHPRLPLPCLSGSSAPTRRRRRSSYSQGGRLRAQRWAARGPAVPGLPADVKEAQSLSVALPLGDRRG